MEQLLPSRSFAQAVQRVPGTSPQENMVRSSRACTEQMCSGHLLCVDQKLCSALVQKAAALLTGPSSWIPLVEVPGQPLARPVCAGPAGEHGCRMHVYSPYAVVRYCDSILACTSVYAHYTSCLDNGR